jgi:hypothetical protein
MEERQRGLARALVVDPLVPDGLAHGPRSVLVGHTATSQGAAACYSVLARGRSRINRPCRPQVSPPPLGRRQPIGAVFRVRVGLFFET